MTFGSLVKQVILDLKKQYAVPVYDRNNIHEIDEEELVLTINDQFFIYFCFFIFLMILLKIRGSCISYASFKKKEETRLENEIVSIIKHLEDNLNKNNVHQLEEKRQELTELRKKKVEGMIVRSRAKWIYEGEQNSKYVCNLEKKKGILYRRQCVLFKKMMATLFMTVNFPGS